MTVLPNKHYSEHRGETGRQRTTGERLEKRRGQQVSSTAGGRRSTVQSWVEWSGLWPGSTESDKEYKSSKSIMTYSYHKNTVCLATSEVDMPSVNLAIHGGPKWHHFQLLNIMPHKNCKTPDNFTILTMLTIAINYSQLKCAHLFGKKNFHNYFGTPLSLHTQIVNQTAFVVNQSDHGAAITIYSHKYSTIWLCLYRQAKNDAVWWKWCVSKQKL